MLFVFIVNACDELNMLVTSNTTQSLLSTWSEISLRNICARQIQKRFRSTKMSEYHYTVVSSLFKCLCVFNSRGSFNKIIIQCISINFVDQYFVLEANEHE